MNRPHGFIALPLMWWGAIAAGAVILSLRVAVKVQSGSLGTAQHELATEQANRALWQKAAETCSKAIEEAAAEAKKRSRNAQAALRDARQGFVKAESEIARLKAQKPSGGACPAGEAVLEVRKGLR